MRLDKPRIRPLGDDEIDPAVGERLGDGPPLNIFRTLAHHPGLAKRWMVFGNHVMGAMANRASIGLWGSLLLWWLLIPWGVYLHWKRRRKQSALDD